MRIVDMSDPNRALSPEEAADRTFAGHEHDSDRLDAFTECLDPLGGGVWFARTIEIWGLSQAEAARPFGVSRQAVGKWLRQGAPPDRAGAMADRPVRRHRSAGAPISKAILAILISLATAAAAGC